MVLLFICNSFGVSGFCTFARLGFSRVICGVGRRFIDNLICSPRLEFCLGIVGSLIVIERKIISLMFKGAQVRDKAGL